MMFKCFLTLTLVCSVTLRDDLPTVVDQVGRLFPAPMTDVSGGAAQSLEDADAWLDHELFPWEETSSDHSEVPIPLGDNNLPAALELEEESQTEDPLTLGPKTLELAFAGLCHFHEDDLCFTASLISFHPLQCLRI